MILVIVASRAGTFLFTIFADLSAILGRMSWTISNFSFVFARWVFFVRWVFSRRPLLQGKVEFRGDVLDWRDRLLRLGSERDLRRAKVDQDDGGPERNPLAAPLLEAIAAPVDRRDGVSQGATAGLVQEGHAICEAQHLDGLVGR